MSNQVQVVTNVNIQGVAFADYDTAVFSMSALTHGKTSEAAKEDLKEKVIKLNEALDFLKKDGLVYVKDTYKTNSSIQQEWAWNEKKSKNIKTGFSASYSVSFHTENMDLVNKVYDILTSLEDVQVNSPSFKLKNLDELHKEGLKDAFAKAKVRLSQECQVLGIDESSLKIHSWNVNYSDNELARRTSAGVMRAMSAVGESYSASASNQHDTLNLNPGKSTVNVNLSLQYTKQQ